MAKKTKKLDIKFSQKLVLHTYFLNQLGFNDFEALATVLKSAKEGSDENNVSYFYKTLVDSACFEDAEIDKDMLLNYDMNISKHTLSMQGKRKNPIKWKYFQWLCLLFVEMYLDKLFKDKETFLTELNTFKNRFMQFIDIPDYELKDLTKIAIWNATGSGKTLLMHANIMQYRYYLEKNGKTNELNKILLITPNEGLSKQHLNNFNTSKIDAEIFDKKAGQLFSSKKVEIIEISKLKDEGKEKTVSVDAFENNNLVLVDEVHKGTQGNEWKEKRDRLSKEGFAFEYSATLGQAVKAANKADIENEYAKATIFDYSYKWFYGDGYGKDYRILNLEDDTNELIRKKYLTGCLLSYYQQLYAYEQNKTAIKPYNIEKPLWIFVGGTVTAVRKEKGKAVSDVLDVILFLSEFIKNKEESINFINQLTSGKTGLIDKNGKDIFSNTFSIVGNIFEEVLYQNILEKVFNANAPGLIHVDDLKGANGEISLSIGDNDPFGLINVGDSNELIKLCKEHSELVISDKNFNGSMFDTIGSEKSSINVLIGSKKFTEGWDCFRVSTMGLMNIGRSEGSEIIQLFGRGVRLRGYENCLKRSSALNNIKLSKEFENNLRHLETLNIFGVRADYMKQFREYLEDEGLPSGNKEEYIIPVIKANFSKTKLKVIKLKAGVDFKTQADKPYLEFTEYAIKNNVILDWYPKIQAIKSEKAKGGNSGLIKEEQKLTENHLAFVDWDKVYLEMQQFKAEKSWYNLNLDKNKMIDLFNRNDWYKLYIPAADLYLDSFSVFDRVYDIVISLLKKYCEKFYNYKKSDWEKDKLEYQELTPEDSNFFEEYKIYVQESEVDLINKIKELKEIVSNGQLRDLNIVNGKSLSFGTHLYNPILSLENNELIEVKPIALNVGETKFVEDLRSYYNSNKEKYQNEEIYLLRNRSRGSGMGFFEEGGFYPDFVLWRIKDNKQYITFIDPKGIYNLEGGQENPKLQFFKRIKDIESQLNDKDIILNSLIVSGTDYNRISWKGNWSINDFEAHNVLFQDDESYIGKIFKSI